MRHFIPVTGLSAEELADVFINRIYCLHGLPDNIVSDRGTLLRTKSLLIAPVYRLRS
jgi:hypothetical protein